MNLVRDDLVGHALKRLWRTEWSGDHDWSSCREFVELSNGVVFEITSQDLEKPGAILRIERDRLDSLVDPHDIGIDEEWLTQHYVREVAVSDHWMSFALVLSGGCLLLRYSNPVFRSIGLVLCDIDGDDCSEGVFTFFGREPLDLRLFVE